MDLDALDRMHHQSSWRSVSHLPLSHDAQEAILVGGHELGWAVIRNPYTERRLIEWVVAKGSEELRVQVAMTYRVEDVQRHLLLDSSAKVREHLAEYTPFLDLIEALLAQDDEMIRWNVATNKHASVDQLRRLSLFHQEPYLLEALESHPALPANELLDGSWGAQFLRSYRTHVFERIVVGAGISTVEARTLAESWRGSLDDLVEALSLVSL